ncbi:MAG: hypothetical protein GY714_22330, partial [Desulfobacterales bacterium]|nr:hypothetical protein [Desulfobacterales bacterium]
TPVNVSPSPVERAPHGKARVIIDDWPISAYMETVNNSTKNIKICLLTNNHSHM